MSLRLSLDISHLGDEGARSMAVALTQNTSLEYLCLKYNGFTPQGVACLFDALQVLLTISPPHVCTSC
jgi:hypothetical protein